jgi:MraZ protein
VEGRKFRVSHYFINCMLNVIDGKNRVSIPSEYRQAIDARTGTRDLRLAPSRNATCLVGFDKDRPDQLMADHRERFAGQNSREKDRDATQIFAGMVAMTIDDAGRIVLPPVTKRLRKLESHAFFIGLGEYFEIWDPWVYLAAEDADEVVLEALHEEFAFKKLSPVGPPSP